MICIEKSDTPPEILQTEGANKRRSHSVTFAYDPEGFRSGDRDFEFDSDIYGADAVKTALIEAQHRKCCFCESKIKHVTYGDVEHYRPKAAYRQAPDEPEQPPGYYWLAYEWTNLFLSCPLCNRRHKRNLFPLRNPDARATSHRDDVDEEEPLFLHPGRSAPEAHIGFRKATAFARNGSKRGGRTIAALQLNRDALHEMRRDYYETAFKELKGLLRFLESGNLTVSEEQEARRHVRRILERKRKDVKQDDNQYASMLRDAVETFVTEAPVDLT
jgi:uncharacterized protein (TIGR02646 family)